MVKRKRRGRSAKTTVSTDDTTIMSTVGTPEALQSTVGTVLAVMKESGEMLTNLPYVKGGAGVALYILGAIEVIHSPPGP